MNLDELRRDRNVLLAELELAGAKIGKGNAMNCPFHSDRRPSAGIYQAQDGVWRFKCQASDCNFGGDVFDVRARATGRPLAEVLLEALGNNHPKQKQATKRQSKSESKIYPNLDLLRAALPGQVITQHDYVNPVTGQNELIIFRCQVDDKKSYRPAYPVENGFTIGAPQKPWPLYKHDAIVDSDTIVVAEGEKCVETLLKFGISATTNAFGAGKAEHADWTPLAGKNIILWPDNDVAGRNHAKQIQTILEQLNPEPTINWIDPNKLDLQKGEDVADFIKQLKTISKTSEEITTELQNIITTAKPCRISEGLKTRLDQTVTGQRIAIDWPWPKLSKLSQALLPQTVTILCGDPGATKSFALLQSLAFWFEKGIKIACLELEENREYHLHRVLAQRERNSNLFDAEWIRENPKQVRAAFERHKAFMDIFGKSIWQRPKNQATLEYIAQWITDRAEEGCRIIAIDSVSAAEPVVQVWIADSKFITACTSAIENFGASLILILHPRKGSKGAVGLDDLAGGASYQRLSQTILWLERHKKPRDELISTDLGRTQIKINRTMHICKTRNGPGHGLSLGYNFDGSNLLLSEQGVIIEQD